MRTAKLAWVLLGLSLVAALCANAGDWPQWRGPELNGISKETNLPVKWGPDDNIAWKLPMPALSGSTPAIWGNRIFLNIALNEGSGDLELWSVDRTKPAVLWKRPMGSGNTKMRKQNMSSPSPVTDGKSVFALTGTGILKSFDYDGKELWSRDIQKEYGAFGLNWGYASSPLLWDGSLFVQVLHGMRTKDASYILRIDAKTGKTTWRVERPTAAIRESPDSYTTPVIAPVGSGHELIISGADVITAHDPATGKELWRGTGFNPDNNPNYRTIASAVFSDGIVYVPTRIRPLQAFRVGGRGDVTQTHRVFQFDNGPDVPTPLVDGKYFYVVNDRGIVWCLDAKTGKEIYGGQRIKPGTYSASPLLADGKIYITSEDGVTTVLKAGPKFEVISENNLDDYCLSSFAVSDSQLFLRTNKFLYAIGKRTSK
ncbi:MAG: PQQ-binding-like beta-propeller repeat protein [Bryobacteraceae bacterium]